MTENEAIKDIKENVQPSVGGKSLEMAIQALEEIQAYRAIGLTPQMVKDLIVSEKKAHKVALENADMLDEYRAIGTVEDLKALSSMEIEEWKQLKRYRELGTYKQVRVAVERMKPKKIIAKKKTISYLGTDYYCPTCDERQLTAYAISKGDDYCKDCGQHLDWS